MIDKLFGGGWDVFWYLVAILILVAFHEFGHFWAARRLGVRVLRFSVGFGKPLWSRTAKDGVQYVIGSIPLGGYVKLLDEREGEVAEQDRPYAFNRQPVWSRILIFAAGPGFNFVLAVLLFWAMFVAGVPDMKSLLAAPPAHSAAATAGLRDGDRVIRFGDEPVETWNRLHHLVLNAALDHGTVPIAVVGRDGAARSASLDFAKVRLEPKYLFGDLGLSPYQPALPPQLGEIRAGSAAEGAGFQSGDRVLAIDGATVASFQEMAKVISAHPGQTLKIEFQRGPDKLEKTVLIGTIRDEDGNARGLLGAAPASVAIDDKLWQDAAARTRLGPLQAIPAAFGQTWDATLLTAEFIRRMFTGEVSFRNVSGPIQTGQIAGAAAHAGFSRFLELLAIISVNVGIFNLIPIPILDGGQIVNLLIEGAKGGPLSQRAQELVQRFGLALLVLIIGFVFYNDITRYIG